VFIELIELIRSPGTFAPRSMENGEEPFLSLVFVGDGVPIRCWALGEEWPPLNSMDLEEDLGLGLLSGEKGEGGVLLSGEEVGFVVGGEWTFFTIGKLDLEDDLSRFGIVEVKLGVLWFPPSSTD